MNWPVLFAFTVVLVLIGFIPGFWAGWLARNNRDGVLIHWWVRRQIRELLDFFP
jgi:hypothetical protein